MTQPQVATEDLLTSFLEPISVQKAAVTEQRPHSTRTFVGARFAGIESFRI